MGYRISSKFRFWRSVALLGMIQSALYLVILYVAKLIGFKITWAIIVQFAALSVGASFFIPFIFSRLAYTGRRNNEFEKFVRNYEEESWEHIEKTFGQKLFFRLYNEHLNQVPCDAIVLCRELLARKELQDKKDTPFYLHIILAKFLVKEVRYKDAIKELELAILMRPKDLVVNFSIGETYERLGDAQSAIRHYAASLEDPAVTPRSGNLLRWKSEGYKNRAPGKRGHRLVFGI